MRPEMDVRRNWASSQNLISAQSLRSLGPGALPASYNLLHFKLGLMQPSPIRELRLQSGHNSWAVGAAPGELWEPVHQHQMARHLSEWMHGCARKDAGKQAVGLDSLPHLAYFIMPEISPWLSLDGQLCARMHQGPSPQRCGPFMPPGAALLASPCSPEVPSLTPPNVLSSPCPSRLTSCFLTHPRVPRLLLVTLPRGFKHDLLYHFPGQANTSTQHLLLSCQARPLDLPGAVGQHGDCRAGEWEGHGGSGCAGQGALGGVRVLAGKEVPAEAG